MSVVPMLGAESHSGAAADRDVAVDTLGVGAMDELASPRALALAPRRSGDRRRE
jgi:hypothetical protein